MDGRGREGGGGATVPGTPGGLRVLLHAEEEADERRSPKIER